MKRDFNEIISTLKQSIVDYEYYVNFKKVYRNVDKYKIELNILNSLIGSESIEKEFLELMSEYPTVLRVVPMLIAVRNSKVQIIDEKLIEFKFDEPNQPVELYAKFMQKTGLFDLIANNKIKNLNDYLTGVEVGLDTNARKNRTGHTMENVVEDFIIKTGLQYDNEMNKKAILDKYGVDLSDIKLGEVKSKNADKRFDFVVKGKKYLYLIETNFYGSGGSKLNETARSYKALSSQLTDHKEVIFVWITDGKGWLSTKRGLREAYEVMDNLYTIKDLENNILEKLFK